MSANIDSYVNTKDNNVDTGFVCTILNKKGLTGNNEKPLNLDNNNVPTIDTSSSPTSSLDTAAIGVYVKSQSQPHFNGLVATTNNCVINNGTKNWVFKSDGVLQLPGVLKLPANGSISCGEKNWGFNNTTGDLELPENGSVSYTPSSHHTRNMWRSVTGREENPTTIKEAIEQLLEVLYNKKKVLMVS